MSTDPAAGTQAQPGSKVTMNVSKGNQPTAAAQRPGPDGGQAKQILKDAGFTNVSASGRRPVRGPGRRNQSPATARPSPTSRSR